MIGIRFNEAEAGLEGDFRSYARTRGKSQAVCAKELIALGLAGLRAGLDAAAAATAISAQLDELLMRIADIQNRVPRSAEANRVLMLTLLECMMHLRYLASGNQDKFVAAQQGAATTYKQLLHEGTV
ncbi:hypothetical protein [Hydrocarboniphaga effusa]